MLKISDVEPVTALDGLFTDGKISGGIPPTRLVAAWFNAVQTELVNVVEGAGIAINPEDSAQVLEAIKKLALSAMPSIPVTSVNNKNGAVVLNASDVGAYSPENCPLPVGAILQMGNDTNPASIYPGTAWKDLAGDYSGRVMSIGPAMETGGSNDVTLSADNLPDHKHKAGDQAPGGVWSTDVTHGTDNKKTASLGYTSETLKPDNTNVSNSSFSVRNAYVAFRTWMRIA